LCVWMYEEEFHGRAFRKFIEAYGERVPDSYRTDMFMRRGPGERIDELGQVVLSRVFPKGWPAVHMVWGAIQEYTTYTAYQALIERVDHPILSELCRRIMKQELRHYAFYNQQAKRRLESSPFAQKLCSIALKIGWTPVGDGMCEKDHVLHATRFLFDGIDGDAILQIERKVRELPGLEWFDLFSKFARDNDIRAAPSAWMPCARQTAPRVATTAA